MMNKSGRAYEPPKAKIYRFDDNDKILTDSSSVTPNYAANALNQFMEGINTTIEKN
ncbi:MAG: hypothetical protein MR436_11880 [Eubacterium sp.]|nr:hypothetical protein [Eubacterium sp.]